MLIDKGPLPNPGGSTGHASNFIFPADHSREMTALTLDSVRQYDELGVLTTCGGLEVARTEERMEELRRRMASAKSWGIEPVSLVTPAEIKELVPYIDESVIIGGFYSPTVGVVDSLRAGTLMRERAQESGALTVSREQRGARDRRRGRARQARADDEGRRRGRHGRDLLRSLEPAAGAHGRRFDPAHARRPPDDRHRPRAALCGAKSAIENPIVRDMDTNMYERQDGTGLEVGSYAHRAILHDPEEIPSIEESALSPTELPFTEDDFVQQMEHALELMPEIVGDESVGIKYAINGLLSLTPDGLPILGETPEVKGLWSAAAVWVKEGPGVGRALAEWMVEGESEIDLQASDIARFHEHHKSVEHVRARAAEGFNKTYGIVHPGEQWESNRGVRLSPFHQRERELGAVFYEAAGWERPHWYASNEPLVEEYGDRINGREAEWDSRWWSPIINAEHLAMRDRAAMFDLTAFCVFDVVGPGALECVQKVSMRQMDAKLGRVVYTPVLTPGGGFRSDLTVMRLADDHFRVVTGGAHGMADLKWYADHVPEDGTAQVFDLTSSWCTLGLWGPRARDILASTTSDDISHEGFPFATCRTIEMGSLRVLASRISYVGDLGWELYVPLEQGARLWDMVWEAGPAARRGARRHRRLWHHRAPREVLPRVRLRARRRVRRGRGRNGLGQGQGTGLRRQGGARSPARGGSGGGAVHSHGGRSQPERRHGALHARRRAGAHARRRLAHRRQGPPLVCHERRGRSVDRQAHPALLPAPRTGGGGQRARRRVHVRALPRDRGRRRLDAGVRSRELEDPVLR